MTCIYKLVEDVKEIVQVAGKIFLLKWRDKDGVCKRGKGNDSGTWWKREH